MWEQCCHRADDSVRVWKPEQESKTLRMKMEDKGVVRGGHGSSEFGSGESGDWQYEGCWVSPSGDARCPERRWEYSVPGGNCKWGVALASQTEVTDVGGAPRSGALRDIAQFGRASDV